MGSVQSIAGSVAAASALPTVARNQTAPAASASPQPQATQAVAAIQTQLTLTQLTEEPLSELQQQAEQGNTLAAQVLAQEQPATYTAQGAATVAAGPPPGSAGINFLV